MKGMPVTARLMALLVLLALTGCGGWHLRGTQDAGHIAHTVMIKSNNARVVGNALNNAIRERGGNVVQNAGKADLVIEIEHERFDDRVLSVDSRTGKVREVEVGLAVTYSVRTGDGRLLVPREEVVFSNDYVFDEGSVLGTNENDRVVRRELSELAATSLALRVQTLRLPEASAGS